MEQVPVTGHVSGLFGVPSVPAGMIARPRLAQQLNAWDDVTVVCGPTGSGKSTLIAMWAESVSLRVFWCEPDHGKLPFREVERFAERGTGVLVIDHADYVEAGEYSRLGAVIDRSPNFRVIITTRTPRTIRRLSSATHAAIDVIADHDLAFSLDELSDANVLASVSERKELLRKSHGLAVAVREKLEDARLGTSTARQRFRARLQEDLNAHQGWYEAALKLSLLPRVDEDILKSWGLPPELLHGLDQAGVADWDNNWLVLNPYVRGVLLEDAERLLPAEYRHRLLKLAVRSTLIDRDPLLAISTAFHIHDLNLATEVTFQNMLELLESRDATYEVFTSVPASKLRAHPVLTIMLVLLSNVDPQTRPRALQLLASESLFLRLQPGRGTHRERVVYRVFEAVALRLTPLAATAIPLVRRAFNDLVELSDEDFEKLGRFGPMLHVHMGISAFYFRDFALARQCFELADVKHAEARRHDRVDPLSLRGGLAALSGDLATARRLLDEADSAPWPPGWRTSSPADFFNLGRAILALEDGHSEAADVHIQAAGPIEEVLEHWQVFALVRARRDQLAGEPELGLLRLKHVRKARNGSPSTPLGQSFLDAAEAELLLSTGKINAARLVASQSAKHSATCRLILASAELALGRSSSAARHAQRVIKDPHSVPRGLLEADLILLCVALRGGFDREVPSIAERVADRLAATGLRAALRSIALQDRDPLALALTRAGVDHATTSLVGTKPTIGDVEATPAISLTPREQQVLESLDNTLTLDEIAALLFISRNTLKTQLTSVYRKLGVSSREAALTRAAVLGILE